MYFIGIVSSSRPPAGFHVVIRRAAGWYRQVMTMAGYQDFVPVLL